MGKCVWLSYLYNEIRIVYDKYWIEGYTGERIYRDSIDGILKASKKNARNEFLDSQG